MVQVPGKITTNTGSEKLDNILSKILNFNLKDVLGVGGPGSKKQTLSSGLTKGSVFDQNLAKEISTKNIEIKPEDISIEPVQTSDERLISYIHEFSKNMLNNKNISHIMDKLDKLFVIK